MFILVKKNILDYLAFLFVAKNDGKINNPFFIKRNGELGITLLSKVENNYFMALINKDFLFFTAVRHILFLSAEWTFVVCLLRSSHQYLLIF